MNFYILGVSAGLASVALAAYLLGQVYSSKLKVSLPPYGRVNWRDVAVILTGLSLLPLVLRIVPGFYVSVWIALAFLSSLVWLFMPIVKRALIGVSLAAALVLSQFFLRLIWLNDVITVLGTCFVAIYAVQGGITIKEAVYLGIGYSIYDLFAVSLFAPLFSLSFYTSPLIPVIVVQYIGTGAFVGMGGADLLLFVLFALLLARKSGVALAVAFSTLGAITIFALSSLFLTIPASPFLFTLFLGVFGVGQAVSKKGIPSLYSNSGDSVA